MFANSLGRGAPRRGIVLVLILGMLGLLALIGVTFATFAGQSLINARNFSQSESRTNAEQYFDFALGQLINDTNNPLSALRGHSLLRDGYGNDSVHRGTTAAETRGYLDHIINNAGASQPLYFTNTQPYNSNKNSPFTGLTQYITNIPTAQASYQYYGLNFTHWILRLSGGGGAAQTFEVLEDDDTGNTPAGNVHVLTLSPSDGSAKIFRNTKVDTSSIPFLPVAGTAVLLTQPVVNTSTNTSFPFTLDGRYMRAFNGPGMTRSLLATATAAIAANNPLPLVPFNTAAYANFRTNGGLVTTSFPTTDATTNYGYPTQPFPGDPDVIGMDEDYDACDLENWFIAIQSADGQVVIPSFHRPGILTLADWQAVFNPSASTPAQIAQNRQAIAGMSKILRPRLIDNSPQFPADPIPDSSTGKIKYDIDNDGDGVTDSIWLDLGYPVQRDSGGKLFKPLFAFMMIGQNGRLPLNTVGNLQSRDFQTVKQYNNAVDASGNPAYSGPQTFYDAPTWDQASHLGNSVNEINPKFALQNAPANVYSQNATVANPAVLGDNIQNFPNQNSYFSQLDNVGVNVALTQLRNALAGTIPMDSLTNPNTANSQEYNYVTVNNKAYYLPNGVIDGSDTGYNTDPTKLDLRRSGAAPVPGRWGEAEGVPTRFAMNSGSIFAGFSPPPPIYYNPVRAGRSIYSRAGYSPGNSYQPTADALDDDFDSLDPQLTASIAEYTQLQDGVGQFAVASERIQRYVNPFDPSGTGRLVSYMNRPDDSTDFGTGFDRFGRVGFFRYFRPPGIPRDVNYPIPYQPNPTQGLRGNLDAYKMAVFGYNADLGIPMIPNQSNNLYHGYESARAPISNNSPFSNADQAVKIAVSSAMPYDSYSQGTYTGVPVVGDSSGTPPYLSTTSGFTGPTASTSVNSESGPYLFGNLPPAHPSGSGNLPYMDQTPTPNALNARVVNGYPMGSLNKDEADEMNLYTPNRNDMPYGPSDLEWLYRKQDVDGSTLNSRLSKLAPVSFLNPVDGQMRRRFFSIDTWEPNNFVYANDNPQGAFAWNSRFGQLASASLGLTNQVVANPNAATADPEYFASAFGVQGVPNPTLPVPIGAYAPNPTATATPLPLTLTGSATNTDSRPQVMFTKGYSDSAPATQLTNGVHADLFARPDPSANTIAYPTLTPPIAHRDRRINLNFPLPVASDPAEPVRQKWVRETYQLLKATLPPQAVDTPQELAALSQFVVNIIDFRDPDSTMTRFVNTDLMVVPADPLNNTPSNVKFAEIPVPVITDSAPAWDPNATKTAIGFGSPFDPNIAYEQTFPSTNWTTAMTDTSGATPRPIPPFLVQYGMEYNPIALNEVLCYSFTPSPGGATPPVDRFYIELVNTLTDDSSHAGPRGSEDLLLPGWDLVIMPDDAQGRPDPITGCLTPNAGGIALAAPLPYTTTGGTRTATPPTFGNMTTPNPTGTQSLPGTNGAFPTTSIGWSFGDGLIRDFNTPNAANNAAPVPPIQVAGGSPRPTFYVMANQTSTAAGRPSDLVPIDNTPRCTMPASFAPSATRPPIGTGGFYWLYLRRPANPFNPTGEMVVVDSMRFPWAADDGGRTTDPTGKPSASTVRLFSAQRLQPYRGGQLVPSPFPNPPFAYGYSEQAAGDTTSKTNAVSGGAGQTAYVGAGYWPPAAGTTTNVPVTQNIYETIGFPTGNADPSWDYFPFHDRDFSSAAELLLVPGCPPGLFTRQFAETLFNPSATTGAPITSATTAPTLTPRFTGGQPHAFPYLPDKFYYTAASVSPDPQSTAPYPNQVGGWTGTGWHKMFDFFEVPSSANGAIGTADNGENFDWARADRRPGLLNLNLIIDEEVFFGLIDDPRLNIALGQYYTGTNWVLPQIVTQVDSLGYPTMVHSISDPNLNTITTAGAGQTLIPNAPASFPLGNPGGGTPFVNNAAVGRGFLYGDPVNSGLGYGQNTIHGMKGAFADFLMLRHGGSPFLFGHGSGLVQDGNPTFVSTIQNDPTMHAPVNSIPADTPYHSLSYPDINATIMRLAYLPPSALTNTQPNPVAPYAYQPGTNNSPPTDPGSGNYALDPGVRFPYLDLNFNTGATTPTMPTTPQIPPIPPRRWFQVPDVFAGGGLSSNASLAGDNRINIPNPDQYLAYQNAALAGGNSLVPFETQYVAAPAPANVSGSPPYLTQNYYLGANTTTGANPVFDNRQHPAYRTELLQKVMNLTTVRTHQFAVWITVGFFEVTRVGVPELGRPDVLGGELGLAAGANVRYRSFFVLDRTKATGFNPYFPGEFRDCVTYRRRIE